jgi:pimeloyl-ACP methyl ester carboxylesterase
LAQAGFTSLRLDLGGVGDSPASGAHGTFVESAVADVRSCMHQLEREHGARQFVLFGLCSGADNGVATALADERVVGLVLLDPHSYANRRSRLRKLAKRLGEFGSVGEAARWGATGAVRRVRAEVERRLRRAAARGAGEEQGEPPAPGREPPPIDVMRTQLETLVNRNVKILAVYSGAYGERYNHRDQLFELFPTVRGRVDLQYFPAANHMFTELAAQAALMDAVTSWVTRTFA